MTAEQGIEIVKSIQMQMNAQEQQKFKELILEQVEQQESKIQKCLARIIGKTKNAKIANRFDPKNTK